MPNEMDLALAQLEVDLEIDRFYKVHAFHNLIMDGESAYRRGRPAESSIAERLAEAVVQVKHDPHLYCLEKLLDDRCNPQLWRDVLDHIERGEKRVSDLRQT